MRSTTRFLALVLSCILTIGAMSFAASASNFTDVPAEDETLSKAVDLLASVGITKGTTETTFGTNEKVTRQQMAAFIYRMMKAGKSVEGGENNTPFTDLDDPTFYFMISWANDTGVIKGTSATTFNPRGDITLQDAYVMVTRALGYEKKGALEYPFGYIDVAEKIGLDKGMPSSVKYDSSLTRGNVAIILYNAFYADMATGTTAFRSILEPYELEDGTIKYVETGSEQYTQYDTVAEKIFSLKKTIQRVVATPNYSLDDYEKTENDPDDTTMVKLAYKTSVNDPDYDADDDGLFAEIDFEELGLEGKADDYFLFDISIYYKKENAGDTPEIFAATSLGNVKKNVAGSKVKFEYTSTNNYKDMFKKGTETRYRRFTGKVTVDGMVTYLFGAPFTYSKPKAYADKDADDITLLFLGATDRYTDDEDELADYVQDYNFKSHTDPFGFGPDWYAEQKGVYYLDADFSKSENRYLKDVDPRGIGLYTDWGLFKLCSLDLHSVKNFEVDVWDSNGDGKLDYMWFKPYTVGRASLDEGEPTYEMHNSATGAYSNDMFMPIYRQYEIPTIYCYGATIEGPKPKDGQLVKCYLNGPANYIKVSTCDEWKLETHKVTGTRSSDGNSVALDGSYIATFGGTYTWLGFPDHVGSRETAEGYAGKARNFNDAIGSQGSYIKRLKDHVGDEFRMIQVGSHVLYAELATSILNSGDDYAIIFPNTNGAYTYSTAVGIVDNGNLIRTGQYVQLLIDGKLQDVPVKVVKTTGDADLQPVTEYEPNTGVYDFTPYQNKLLTYTINADDEYVLKIAPLEANNDFSKMAGDEDDAFYAFVGDSETFSGFVKTGSNLYQFVLAGTNTRNGDLMPGTTWKYMNFTEDTKIVIKTVDDEGEDQFTIYDIDKMPNFDNSVEFKNITYILKNNTSSSAIEDLVYMYAESDGDMTSSIGKVYQYRFVKSAKKVKEKDDKVITYLDVYNPFKGIIEEEYEAAGDEDVILNGIYTLTSDGYLADGKLFGRIDAMGRPATSKVTANNARTNPVGLVAIDEYDPNGFDKGVGMLSVEGSDLMFEVTSDTVVTFLDIDKETIAKKTSDILGSTSKTYRCGDKSANVQPLLAFIVSSEVKKETDYEHAEVIVVVRYDTLANNG